MNPFIYGVAVTGNTFFDRKEECARIVNTLAGGNNMVLYAPRRFGKTSLVYKAMSELGQQGFICIYFDFMPVYSLDSFYRLFYKTLAEKQSVYANFIQKFVSLIKNIRPISTIGDDGKPEWSLDVSNRNITETDVEKLFDLVEELSSDDKKIIIFFDEFQEIKNLEGVKFEALLRSKIQRQKNVKYMFFGSKTHIIKEMFNNKKHPFYQSAMQMSLGFLPEQDTINYLKTQFQKSSIAIDENCCKYIIHKVSAIPHYIQMLASEIWQRVVTTKIEINAELIDVCAEQIIMLKNDYYQELFVQQSISKKQLLQALCSSGKNIFSENYLRNNNLPAASTIQRAAKGLLNSGIIDKQHDEYFISDPFFKMYIKKFS